ncbi:hypothetical protein Nmel_017100 [Mimus melanotis]
MSGHSPGVPRRFQELTLCRGYGQPPAHPRFRTANQAYGSRAPTVHELPVRQRPSSRVRAHPRYSRALQVLALLVFKTSPQPAFLATRRTPSTPCRTSFRII